MITPVTTGILAGSGLVGYESETITLLAVLTGTYDDTRKAGINTLIKGLKADGLWNAIDRLNVVGLNSTDSLRCWKSLTLATNNGMTFVSDRGFTGNGSSSYINTNFNPSTASGNFSLNSASLGLWSRTDSNPSLARDMGARTAFNDDESILILKETNNGFYALNADGNTPGYAIDTSTGWFSNSRTNETNLAFYRNGSMLVSQGLSSSSMPNQPVYVGAVNNGGTIVGPTARQYSSWLIASGYTSAQHGNLYSHLNTYLTAIGAN